MLKIIFFVPIENKEKVKSAMFEAGAGKIGNYDCCSFEVYGKGQFRPLTGSSPTLGKHGRLETVDEARVEMVVDTDRIDQVVAAMKSAHPYEEVAYDIIKIRPDLKFNV